MTKHYVLIPSMQEEVVNELSNGDEVVYSDLFTFYSNTMEFDELRDYLISLSEFGKIGTFILVTEGLLEDSIDVKELFRASIKDDLRERGITQE